MKIVYEMVAALGSVGVPLFITLFFIFFVRAKPAQPKPYLQRVAKKYSIRPLDLR